MSYLETSANEILFPLFHCFVDSVNKYIVFLIRGLLTGAHKFILSHIYYLVHLLIRDRTGIVVQEF